MSRVDRVARLRAPGVPPAVVIMLVMAVLIAIAGIGRAVADPAAVEVAPPVSVPVASKEVVCPAPIARKGVIATTISAVQAPLPNLPPDPMPERPDAAQLSLLIMKTRAKR